MLTAGRLGDTNRAIVKGAIEPCFAGNRPKAIRIAQQLITSSPEFHTTGLARKGDKERVITGYTQSPKHDYKAIVYSFMVGGCDSFNMLVPLSGCSTVSEVLLRAASKISFLLLFSPLCCVCCVARASVCADCAPLLFSLNCCAACCVVRELMIRVLRSSF